MKMFLFATLALLVSGCAVYSDGYTVRSEPVNSYPYYQSTPYNYGYGGFGPTIIYKQHGYSGHHHGHHHGHRHHGWGRR